LLISHVKKGQGHASDDLDESAEEQPSSKKRKRASAKAKGKAKKKTKKGSDDDEYEDDVEIQALKSMWSNGPKPTVGGFEDCADCGQQFTAVSVWHVQKGVVCVTDASLLRLNTPSLLIPARASCVILARRRLVRILSRNRLSHENAKRQLINGPSSILKRNAFRLSSHCASR
jgi:hypothetical protein